MGLKRAGKLQCEIDSPGNAPQNFRQQGRRVLKNGRKSNRGAGMTGNVVDETIRIIAEKIETDPSSITADTKISDIDVSSMDLAEIIFELEDTFDIEIQLNTANAWENLKTVSDIAAEVNRLIESAG